MDSVYLCGRIRVVRRSSPIEEEGGGLERFLLGWVTR